MKSWNLLIEDIKSIITSRPHLLLPKNIWRWFIHQSFWEFSLEYNISISWMIPLFNVSNFNISITQVILIIFFFIFFLQFLLNLLKWMFLLHHFSILRGLTSSFNLQSIFLFSLQSWLNLLRVLLIISWVMRFTPQNWLLDNIGISFPDWISEWQEFELIITIFLSLVRV